MKLKIKKEILTKDLKELKKMLLEARDELFNLRLDKHQNKLKNTRVLSWKRKEIALMLTIIRQKHLALGKERVTK
ncbi:50S ribosomal protein L29 [Patescibacteria group bacterium]|nr:50S ribosomal protein L29 [Patescibacteria group bacterium]